MEPTSFAASAVGDTLRVGGTLSFVVASWTLQDYSSMASIMSAVIAALAGLVYGAKMAVELYWIVKIKKLEAAKLEREQAGE